MGQRTHHKKTSDALNAYSKAVSILGRSWAGGVRRSIRTTAAELAGQALYLARISMMTHTKTHRCPSLQNWAPNKFGIPPAHFDADKEPLIDEYRALFDILEAHRQCAEIRYTVQGRCRSGNVIARAKGLDTGMPQQQAVSAWAVLCRDECNQNVGNGRSINTRKFSNRPSRRSQRSNQVGSDKSLVAAIDPALSLRDDKEEVRAGNLDRRFNHWTAVRDALMNEHVDLFPQVAGS